MKNGIVLIGGGHGLSNLVKSFKDEKDVSVIVASTDDGGHTGKIRDEFDSVAVGDLRMVLGELINDKSTIKGIFDYRFDILHGTNNVSLGNLVIASLWKKLKDVNKVIGYFKEKEGFKPNVYLSSDNPLTLCAECEDGDIVRKERIIGICNKKIKRLFVDKEAICNEEMLLKLEEASIIVLSPGSLFTSVGSVLCIDKIKKAICKSKARIVYVCNIMTQDGETSDYSVSDHVESLEKIMNKKIDRVLVNNGKISEEILKRYKEENSGIVKCVSNKSNYEFYNLVEINDYKVRHNNELVKKIILDQQ